MEKQNQLFLYFELYETEIYLIAHFYLFLYPQSKKIKPKTTSIHSPEDKMITSANRAYD